MACARCGRDAEVHHSELVGGDCCERCYVAAGSMSDTAGAGPPCPTCGEPRGGRYLDPASRRKLCWPCWEQRNPTPRRRRTTAGLDAFARLHERAWKTLEANGTVFTLADRSGRLFGHCPVCRIGTLTVQILGTRHEPFLRVNGCSAGCSDDQIQEALT